MNEFGYWYKYDSTCNLEKGLLGYADTEHTVLEMRGKA